MKVALKKGKGGPRLIVHRTKQELEETERAMQLMLLDNASSALKVAAAAALGAGRAVASYGERVSILGKQLEVGFRRTVPSGSEGVNVAMGAMEHMQLLLTNFGDAVERAGGRARVLKTEIERSIETLGHERVAKLFEEHMSETRDEKLWTYFVALARKGGCDGRAFSRCGPEAQ